MSSNSMPSAQQDAANTTSSDVIPDTSPQSSDIDLIRSLQQQLNAFISQTPIKHRAQVLFNPSAADGIHMITATDDLVPKARVTSLNLFLDIQTFKINQSGNLDADLHMYIPADRLLSTLAQLGRSRPDLKTKVATINYRLASTCFDALARALAYPMLLSRNQDQNCCRIRLAIALYTSSTVLLKYRGRPPVKARLYGWEHVEADGQYVLDLGTDGPTRIQTRVAGTIQNSGQGIFIHLTTTDGEVKLSTMETELDLINDPGERQTHDSQSARTYINPEKAFQCSSSDSEARHGQNTRGVKRKIMHQGERSSLNIEPGVPLARSEDQLGDDVRGDDMLSHARGDTEPLET